MVNPVLVDEIITAEFESFGVKRVVLVIRSWDKSESIISVVDEAVSGLCCCCLLFGGVELKGY